MVNPEFLNSIRKYELNRILPMIPPYENILEIGAGSGFQARLLSDLGYEITAIDIEDNRFRKNQLLEVATYDGLHIPYQDQHFGVIFSSNVLEHIRELDTFQKELHRVLKPGGVVIHILPTGTWRLFTNLSHYLFLVKIILSMIFHKTDQDYSHVSTPINSTLAESSLLIKIRRILASSRHGETGSFLTEVYYFSKSRWRKAFTETGWSIQIYLPGKIFYTGYGIFGSLLPIPARRFLSMFLGSSCHMFILRKTV